MKVPGCMGKVSLVPELMFVARSRVVPGSKGMMQLETKSLVTPSLGSSLCKFCCWHPGLEKRTVNWAKTFCLPSFLSPNEQTCWRSLSKRAATWWYLGWLVRSCSKIENLYDEVRNRIVQHDYHHSNAKVLTYLNHMSLDHIHLTWTVCPWQNCS